MCESPISGVWAPPHMLVFATQWMWWALGSWLYNFQSQRAARRWVSALLRMPAPRPTSARFSVAMQGPIFPIAAHDSEASEDLHVVPQPSMFMSLRQRVFTMSAETLPNARPTDIFVLCFGVPHVDVLCLRALILLCQTFYLFMTIEQPPANAHMIVSFSELFVRLFQSTLASFCVSVVAFWYHNKRHTPSLATRSLIFNYQEGASITMSIHGLYLVVLTVLVVPALVAYFWWIAIQAVAFCCVIYLCMLLQKCVLEYMCRCADSHMFTTVIRLMAAAMLTTAVQSAASWAHLLYFGTPYADVIYAELHMRDLSCYMHNTPFWAMLLLS